MSSLYWTKARCIEAIQDWALHHHGRPPRKHDWKHAAPEHPCHMTVERRFGSWTFGLHLAGYRTRMNEGWWTKARIKLAIRGWEKRHGTPPKSTDWTSAAPEHPCARTVLARFGSWNAAIAAAGFTPRTSGGQPTFTRVQCIRAIKRFHELHGRPPTSIEWHRVAPGRPNLAVIKRRFGTWNNAILLAGFTPRSRGVRLTRTQRLAHLDRKAA